MDGDADVSICFNDAVGDFMIALVVEVSMNNRQDVVLKGTWLVRIDNAISQATSRLHPNLQSPQVVSNVPKTQPLADVIRLRVVCPKIMVEQRLDDPTVVLGLLQQGQDLPGGELVCLHQTAQVVRSVRMNRQGWNDTQSGITRQVDGW